MLRIVCLLLLLGLGCSSRSDTNPELKVPEIPTGRNPDGKGGAPVRAKVPKSSM